MSLTFFNILSGILLIIAAIGFALFMHWNIKTTEDGWLRVRFRCGLMFSLFLFFMGCYNIYYDDSVNSYPTQKSFSDVVVFAIMGVLTCGILLIIQKYKKQKMCYGLIGGYIVGIAMLAISIVCLVSMLL